MVSRCRARQLRCCRRKYAIVTTEKRMACHHREGEIEHMSGIERRRFACLLHCARVVRRLGCPIMPNIALIGIDHAVAIESVSVITRQPHEGRWCFRPYRTALVAYSYAL